MVTKLTTKQKEVLEAIEHHVRLNKEAPTLRQLMNELDYAKPSSVQRHVDALRAKGALPAVKQWKRGVQTDPEPVKYIPLVGSVPCGSPLLAEENVEAHVPYSASRLRSPRAKYFFLRASGTSMNLAGIQDGDLMLVRQQDTANIGDKIIALIGDEATCKFLGQTEDGWYELKPHSSDPKHQKPRVMLEDFSIQGVVEDVISPRRGGN